MIRLLKYFFGYAVFYAYGKFPERFLNLLHRNGIFIWGLRREEDGIRAVVRARQYKKLRIPAKKTGMRVKLKSKRGLPFILHRNRKRFGIPVGIILFLAILNILPLFIWQVDIECDAKNVDPDLLRYQLAQCGLKPGAFIKSVDRGYIKTVITEKNPSISWIGINSGTSRAVIDVRGSKYAPVIENNDYPCNLKAAYDGQIVAVDIEEGELAVKVGDAVAKGDLLVSGIVDSGTGTRHIHSRGTVSAETTRTLEAYVSFEQTVRQKSDESIRLVAIYAFGKEMPLYFKKPQGNFETEFSERRVELFGLKPDISIRNLEMREIAETTVTLSQEEAEEQALLQIAELERVELRGAEIKSFSDRLIEDADGVRIVRTLNCIENIAIKEKINIEN